MTTERRLFEEAGDESVILDKYYIFFLKGSLSDPYFPGSSVRISPIIISHLVFLGFFSLPLLHPGDTEKSRQCRGTQRRGFSVIAHAQRDAGERGRRGPKGVKERGILVNGIGRCEWNGRMRCESSVFFFLLESCRLVKIHPKRLMQNSVFST